MVDYNDLPPALKRRVDAAAGAGQPRGRKSIPPHERTDATWRCVKCGEIFTQWAAVDQHDPTHYRIEQVLDPKP